MLQLFEIDQRMVVRSNDTHEQHHVASTVVAMKSQLTTTPALRIAVTIATVLAVALPTQVHASGSKNNAMVRVEYAGGYVPQEYLYTRMPSPLLIGDRMYVGGVVPAVYPGPALMPVEERKIDRAAAARRAKSVYDAARTPTGGWGEPPVADAPTLVVTVTVAGKTRTASIPSFGMDRVGPGVTEVQASARARMLRALMAIEALTGRSSAYRPKLVEAWVLDGRRGSWVPDDMAQSAPLQWPSGVGHAIGCSVMPYSSFPAGANQASTFTVDGSAEFSAVFRPVLPGEKACRRTVR